MSRKKEISFATKIENMGIEKGRQEGRQEGIFAAISKLFKKGMGIDKISEFFDMSEGEIRSILTSNGVL